LIGSVEIILPPTPFGLAVHQAGSARRCARPCPPRHRSDWGSSARQADVLLLLGRIVADALSFKNGAVGGVIAQVDLSAQLLVATPTKRLARRRMVSDRASMAG
jgi:hypothetical protein